MQLFVFTDTYGQFVDNYYIMVGCRGQIVDTLRTLTDTYGHLSHFWTSMCFYADLC